MANTIVNQNNGAQASDGAKKEAEGQARLAELDASEAARREREQAARSAEEIREDKQKRKARARAMWGKSGVGMSGSAARVMDGMDSDAENRISDIVGSANERAKVALATGQERAGIIRNRVSGSSSQGVNPFAIGQSLLSMGSQIFD